MNGSQPHETRLQGLALSPGCAVARVCLFNEARHQDIPAYRLADTDQVLQQQQRARDAFAQVEVRLDQIRNQVAERVGQAEAEIFVAQRMITGDPQLQQAVFAQIASGFINAEQAVMTVLESYEARLREVDNAYVRERASDLVDVRMRLVDSLRDIRPGQVCAGGWHCQKGRNRIVVANELTPALTVELDTEFTQGIVTARGGVNSHGAILARALAIPAVSAIELDSSQLSCGSEILVNGDTGEVIINPSSATLTALQAQLRASAQPPQSSAAVAGFKVMANISVSSEAAAAVAFGAEGIGLYRTEFDLIAAGRALSEDELYAHYCQVVETMGAARPVMFRMFDVGGDKPLPFLPRYAEENPALGWRGARVLLSMPELFRPQARALARVSKQVPIWVYYPLITDADEFCQLKQAFTTAVADLPSANIAHGLMFEIPAACLQADALLQVADFASVGTNDLIQYLFAVDRNNERVAANYRPDHPVLWQLLHTLAMAAQRHDKPLSVCGEVAGNPRYIRQLFDAGIRSVSVNARQIAAVRAAAAEIVHPSRQG